MDKEEIASEFLRRTILCCLFAIMQVQKETFKIFHVLLTCPYDSFIKILLYQTVYAKDYNKEVILCEDMQMKIVIPKNHKFFIKKNMLILTHHIC